MTAASTPSSTLRATSVIESVSTRPGRSSAQVRTSWAAFWSFSQPPTTGNV
jgi:hypothetical protein